MKYITTDKHPELKEGVIIDDKKLKLGVICLHLFSDYDLELWEHDGLIKELQEPEFTKDDMIEFAFWVLGEQDNYEKETIKLDDWLKQINK